MTSRAPFLALVLIKITVCTSQSNVAEDSLNVNTSTTDTTISLTWQLPRTCRPTIQYISYYQISHDQCPVEDKTINKSSLHDTLTSFNFGDLNPNSVYSVVIDGISNTTNSSCSRRLNATTKEAVPTGTPENLSKVENGVSHIAFEWAKPRCRYRNGDIIGYTYTIRNTVTRVIELSENIQETTVVVIGLKHGTKYRMSVAAQTAVGKGPPAYLISATALDSPRNIILEEFTAEHVTLSWDSLCDKPMCPNLFYDWEIVLANKSQLAQNRRGQVTNFRVQITDLPRCEQFFFTVRAGNTEGLGQPSQTVAVSTLAVAEVINVTTLSTATSVTLNWTLTEACQPTNQSVEYLLINRDHCNATESRAIKVMLDGLAKSVTLTDLSVNSIYATVIRGYLGEMPSMVSSHFLNVTTGEKVPSGEPEELSVVDNGLLFMSFSWAKPRCGARNGKIIGYYYILRNLESEVNQQTGHVSEKVLNVTKFSSYTNYRMRVAAITMVGQGPFATISFTTSEGFPTAPISLLVVNTDDSSITIRWGSPPPFDGAVKAYEVAYTTMPKLKKKLPIVTFVNPKASEYRITSLTAGSTYTINLRAVSRKGNIGAWSEDIVATAEEGVPGFPANLAVNSLEELSITINWNIPQYPNGRILFYTVEYRAIEKPYELNFIKGAFAVRTVIKNIAETSYTDPEFLTLVNLEPSTRYEIRVSANTREGKGESATILEFTDAASDFDPPGQPIVEEITDSTVTIELSLPVTEYITSYLIAVRVLGQQSQITKRSTNISSSSFGLDGNSYVAAIMGKFDFEGEFTVGDNSTYGGCYNPPLESGRTYQIFAGSMSKTTPTSSTLKWSEFVSVTVENSNDGAVPWGLIIGGLAAFLFLVLIIVCVICRVRYISRRAQLKLPDLPDTPKGSSTELKLIGSLKATKKHEDENDYLVPFDDKENPDHYYLTVEASPWDIVWTDLRLSGTVIGRGSFGEVQVGEVKRDGVWVKAAVKSLKPGTPDSDKASFKTEFDTMTKFGSHPNVVSVLGACDYDGTLYVALEYVPYGNLRLYLRNFCKQEDKPDDKNYATLSPEQLLKFGLDVAKGMKHLATAGVIHRDLAARNVLVGDGLIAKVSDFGLSRGEDVYVQRTAQRVPTRWLAIESMRTKTYTTKSDVWSFGILLWEIVTFGETPYPDIEARDIIYRLRDGYRMPQPKQCEDQLYQLMLQCWRENPEERPTFHKVVETLVGIIDQKMIYVNSAVIRKQTPIRYDRDDNQ